MFNQAFAGTLPIQGSDVATHWDVLYNFLLAVSAVFLVLVAGAMAQFAYKYRWKAGRKVSTFTGSHTLEAIFVAVPTVLLLVIFAWGYALYREQVQAPTDAMEIRVIAKQWLFQFQYDNGKSTLGEVFVPLNRPVKLIMTSEDVLHSFFIPNFRVKQDIVPGMYTSVWFEAKVPGKHQVFCTEYCGTSHSGMMAKVVALTDQQWKDWNAGKALGPIPEAGRELTQLDIEAAQKVTLSQTGTLSEQGKVHYETKGCTACHSIDGTTKVGPTLKGLYGSKVGLTDGATVSADDAYLKESIELPMKRVVKGFQPSMPTFQGVLKETEINALIAYIKSLK